MPMFSLPQHTTYAKYRIAPVISCLSPRMEVLDIFYYAFLYIIGLLVMFKVLTFLFTVAVAYFVAKRYPPEPLERRRNS